MRSPWLFASILFGSFILAPQAFAGPLARVYDRLENTNGWIGKTADDEICRLSASWEGGVWGQFEIKVTVENDDFRRSKTISYQTNSGDFVDTDTASKIEMSVNLTDGDFTKLVDRRYFEIKMRSDHPVSVIARLVSGTDFAPGGDAPLRESKIECTGLTRASR